jgi:hypothetical protein
VIGGTGVPAHGMMPPGPFCQGSLVFIQHVHSHLRPCCRPKLCRVWLAILAQLLCPPTHPLCFAPQDGAQVGPGWRVVHTQSSLINHIFAPSHLCR